MNIYEGLELIEEHLVGWHGNNPVFEKLIMETNPTHIIEVGAWLGQSTINMAKILKRDNRNCKITTVDTWLGALEFIGSNNGDHNLMKKNGYPQVYYQFLSNVVHNKVEKYIDPFPSTSLIAARYFEKNNIKAELIYIDGSHDYEDVIADLNAYWPLVKNGGIMFGDDFDIGAWPGVVQAVNEFSDKIKEENGFWILKK